MKENTTSGNFGQPSQKRHLNMFITFYWRFIIHFGIAENEPQKVLKTGRFNNDRQVDITLNTAGTEVVTIVTMQPYI